MVLAVTKRTAPIVSIMPSIGNNETIFFIKKIIPNITAIEALFEILIIKSKLNMKSPSTITDSKSNAIK